MHSLVFVVKTCIKVSHYQTWPEECLQSICMLMFYSSYQALFKTCVTIHKRLQVDITEILHHGIKWVFNTPCKLL